MARQGQVRILEELEIILQQGSEALWMVGVSENKSSQDALTAEAFQGIEGIDSAKFGELHARQGMVEARRRERLEGQIDPSDKHFGGEVGAALKAAESIRMIEGEPFVGKELLRAQRKLADARRRERLGGNGLPNDPSLGDDIEGDARNLVGPEAAATVGANIGKCMARCGHATGGRVLRRNRLGRRMHEHAVMTRVWRYSPEKLKCMQRC